MKTKSIGFIGGGRITKIFLQGFKNQNVMFSSVAVCDTNAEKLNKLKKEYPFIETTEKASDAASKEIVFIALHAPVIGEVPPAVTHSCCWAVMVGTAIPLFSNFFTPFL